MESKYLYEITSDRFLNQNNIQYTLKGTINLYRKNNQINLLNFSQLFNIDLMKQRLIEYFDDTPKNQKQRIHTQIHIKQCPIKVIPLTTTAFQNKNSHKIKRRSSMNLKYYRPKTNPKKKRSYQQQAVDHSYFSKSFQMDLRNLNKFIESNKELPYNKTEKNRSILLDFVKNHKTSLPLSSYVKKRRNTKASELRKQFNNQYVLNREKKLENSRFKITGYKMLDSELFGKSFFLKH